MNRREIIESIAETLRATRGDVERLIRTAPHRYKHYQIPKRSGRGMRDIHHPGPALKIAQRWLVENVLLQLRVHESVYSYVRNRNIKSHALVHKQSNYFLRLDFKDFFPSVDATWIGEFLRREAFESRTAVEPDAIEAITRILCRWDRDRGANVLSIGAPSSPAMTNAILFDLDLALHDACVAQQCVYSRYADDIYISSRRPELRDRIERTAREIIAELVPRLEINETKCQWLSRKRRVLITGLVMTSNRQVSIGRELKRKLKTEVYLWSQDKLAAGRVSTLRGLVAYVDSVESSFTDSLRAKYGDETIDRLLHP